MGPRKPPAAPPVASEYQYENGRLVGNRVYDPATGAFSTSTFTTPEQQALQANAQSGLAGLLPQISQVVQSPETAQAQIGRFAAPQLRALNEAYDQSYTNANENAVASGLKNSVGFGRYITQNLDRNRALDAADIQSNAQSQYLGQLSGLASLFGDTLSGERGYTSNYFGGLLSGSQAGNNAVNQNYQSRLQQFQLTPRSFGNRFISTLSPLGGKLLNG